MQDPFTWKIPLARLFGIQIKIHLLLPIFAASLILREYYRDPKEAVPGAWIDAAIIIGLMFFSVLVHEFGHCFAARAVGGEANEVLLWPLGGLAFAERLPQQPRAHFITAAAGPAATLLLGLVALVALQFCHPAAAPAGAWLSPSWNPFYYTGRLAPGSYAEGSGLIGGLVPLHTWGGKVVCVSPYEASALWAWLFWINYFLFLFNLVLVAWPMDSGRMLQASLWPIYGFRQATFISVIVGFVFMFFVAVYAFARNEMMALFLAWFMYVSCKDEWIRLETGGEESLFGYDFSQGYTSLERDMPQAAPPRKRRQSWWQQYKQKRAAQRLKQEEDTRISEERRMDELLQKVQREGITALTDEERRFMKRVSDRYKNRH
jgi:Zn-dependent protease